MVSRAYHDSLFMARIAPVAMLFIPCRGGVSHRPDEYASREWIGSGVHVLARTLAHWRVEHRRLRASAVLKYRCLRLLRAVYFCPSSVPQTYAAKARRTCVQFSRLLCNRPTRCILSLNLRYASPERGASQALSQPSPMSTTAKNRIVGAPVPRKEGVDKLLGRARYIDDLEREGMWHGATVRSTIPRGLIRAIHFDPANQLE